MIKQIVKWTLLVGTGATLLLFIVGLAVPQSLLVKLSKKSVDKSSKVAKKVDTQTTEQKVATGNQVVSNTQQQSAVSSSQTSSDLPVSSNGTASAITPPSTTTSQPQTTAGTAPSPTPAAVAPMLTFSASPTSVVSGSSSTLSWSINSNATPAVACTASGAWSGTKATSGSVGVTPGSSSTYSLSCTNSAGVSAQSVTVSVSAPPTPCGSAGGVCTAGQIAAHNTAADCWVIYNGNYLILSGSGAAGSNGNEVANHSGGSSRITPYCGADASSAFTSAHGGQSNVKSIFNSYIVGPVN